MSRVTKSIATVSGPDGSVATITTNFDVNTGLAIGGGSGASATSPISGENTITKLLLKDHLGSMTAELTIYGSVDTSGRLVAGSVGIQSVSALVIHGFGPWGLARNGLNGDSRGFTGHEHLAELGLIHMNGRIYDPVIGRFLQADPIIQAPHNAQSHNRYSYVMNNPLSLTDPSGFSSWTRFRDKWLKPAIAIGIALFLGGFDFTAFFANGSFSWTLGGNGFLGAIAGGFASGGIQGGNIQSALQGAFSAALFFGAGGVGLEGSFERVVAHAAAGCASAAAAGGSCGRGAASAGFAAAAGPALGKAMGGSEVAHFVAATVSGGLASKISGGSFQSGAMTAVYGYLFNRTFHEAAQAGNAAAGCTAPTKACSSAQSHARQMRTEMLQNEGVQPVYFAEDTILLGGAVKMLATGVKAAWSSMFAAETVVIAEVKVAQVTLNREAGNAFRDEIAEAFRQMGYDAQTEVYKRTIFGKRFIDIEISKGGQVLGGIETKWGGSPYTAAQQSKDAWLNMSQGYRVNVVRGGQ